MTAKVVSRRSDFSRHSVSATALDTRWSLPNSAYQSVEAAILRQPLIWGLVRHPHFLAGLAVAVVATFVLVRIGLGADASPEAIRTLDCYFFDAGHPACGSDNAGYWNPWTFACNWLAASANAVVLGILVFLGLRCWNLCRAAITGTLALLSTR